MKVIDYCPSDLNYQVYPTVKQLLKDRKIKLIEDINYIQKCLGKQSLTVEQFDFFYDAPIEYLVGLVQDQASLLTYHL